MFQSPIFEIYRETTKPLASITGCSMHQVSVFILNPSVIRMVLCCFFALMVSRDDKLTTDQTLRTQSRTNKQTKARAVKFCLLHASLCSTTLEQIEKRRITAAAHKTDMNKVRLQNLCKNIFFMVRLDDFSCVCARTSPSIVLRQR